MPRSDMPFDLSVSWIAMSLRGYCFFMKTYQVKIQGLTPYMQHRMDDTKLEEWEKKRVPIMERDDVAHEDAVRAEYHCYRNAEVKCFIPSEQIRGSLIGAGSYMKAKVGGRAKSMKVIVAATFQPTPIEILLPDYDSIDKRSAVNKNVKARIMVVRPKWSNWSASFILNVHEDTITKETISQLIAYAGNYVGIGSYRPTANGLFGRFELESISLL
jgi:hypothetical protein